MGSRAGEVTAALRAWLVTGEIVGPDGAMHAWYDVDSQRQAFAYPEITGYALTHLSACADPTPLEREAAARAAAWLVSRVRLGNFAARDGWEGGGTYFFDLAMMANGLLNAARTFADHDADAAARTLVQLMVDEVSRQGHLPAIPAGQPTNRVGWSITGRAHMGKALQSLLYADCDDDIALKRAIDAVLAQTLAEQQPDGRFRTDAVDELTMLHPHLYAVEGLWCYAQATGDETARAAATAGAAWVWRHQLASGGLPRYVPVAPGGTRAPEQLDLTAQALRAAHLTGVQSSASEHAARRLLDLAVDRGKGRLALPYQPDSPHRHLNAWVTLFAVQALGLNDDEKLPWRSLV